MIEAISAATSPPSDDIVANSLVYLVGNFRVKLFYPLPTRLNAGRSRGSRTRLDFDVVMREVCQRLCFPLLSYSSSFLSASTTFVANRHFISFPLFFILGFCCSCNTLAFFL